MIQAWARSYMSKTKFFLRLRAQVFGKHVAIFELHMLQYRAAKLENICPDPH